jgi:hypothetical protein
MQQPSSSAGRIEALDYLRGVFILIIIIDHLWRWPNPFQYISGRGELWVSAAEGFVIISGLLVGYIRGRKNLKLPFVDVSKKLIMRGLMLYAWAIITTLVLVALSWTLTFKSSIAFIPYAPFDWLSVIRDTVLLSYAHTLTHFLYLYAIFLALAPLLVWLLRRRLWWIGVLISVALWWAGVVYNVEWMQWQILFYLPATAGFYLDQIISLGSKIPRMLIWIFVGAALASMVWSAAIILPNPPGQYIMQVFTREPLSLARVTMAFFWFTALAILFNKALPWLEKSVGWLLLPFGTRSLTAYIVHTLPLMIMSFLLPPTDSYIINTLLVIAAVLITWAIVKIPGINKVIPR